MVECDADDPRSWILVLGDAIPSLEGSRKCFVHRILRPFRMACGQKDSSIDRVERGAVEGLETLRSCRIGHGIRTPLSRDGVAN
jgi:hypothetical protein